MNEKQADEHAVEAMQRKIAEQESKILTLTQETTRVKRNSRIMLVSSIVMLAVIVGLLIFPLFLKPTWHEVGTFSGTGNWGTQFPFYVGENWRIRWFVEPDPRPVTANAYFWFFANPDYTIFPSFELRAVTAYDIDAAYYDTLGGVEYITGSGRYDLTVMADDVSWEIIVEEYH